MTDVAGNPEEERRAEFYHQPWSQEAVSRYFYCKVWRGPCASGLPLTLRETSLLCLASGPGHSTSPRTTCSPPCSQMLFQARPGGGVVLSLTSNTITLLLLLFLYRSSSAGRSWSSHWLCATPRSP